MKDTHSFDIECFGGNFTSLLLRITFSAKIYCYVILCPNGLYPNTISYKITPRLHMSTLLDIFGGSELSQPKHSGGKYQ